MTDTQTVDAPFILCFREEGLYINCYIAPNPAVLPAETERYLIATMHARTMNAKPELFQQWKEIMKNVLAVAVREAIGIDLDIDQMREQPGPENERSPGGGH
jgi:hypothetical protein